MGLLNIGEGMEDLKELKALLADEMEESFRRGIINNMPWVPMVIIYMDEEAKKAKEEIDPILIHIWGDREKDIVQITMNGDSFCNAENGADLEEEEVQELIDNMYATDNSFRDMSRLCVITIQSTTFCPDVSEFQKSYERIHKLEEFISDGLLTTSIVFLDESMKCKKIAADIRGYLGELLETHSTHYASTFLLSNRLSNGSLLAGKRVKENYAMAGWMILLLNGIGAGYTPDLSLFYPAGREYFLTAAFSEINRPNDAICDVVLHNMLMWIDKHMRTQGKAQNRSLDLEDLYQRLEISGNKAKFLEDYYQKYVAVRVPTVNEVRYVPRMHPEAIDIGTKDFLTVDKETMGGCTALLSRLPLFRNEMKEDFINYFQHYLRTKMTAGERDRALNASNIQEILRQLQPIEMTGKERVDVYLNGKVYEEYIKWALPLCEELMIKEQKSSAAHTKEFENVLQEFQQGYFPEDSELERYYADITNDELERASGGLGERLLNEVTSRGDQREAILDSLKKAAQEIFSSKPVFRMPLEQEMINRMGQNPNDIHNQIYNTLFKDLDSRIRLKTAIALASQKQITIVNQRDENGSDTELYQSIKKNVSDGANMIYFDSCNSNTIKIIRFYSCERSNLI